MLAAPNDDDDPFLTLDDDENERDDCQWYAEWLHVATHFLAQDIYCAWRKHGIHVCRRGVIEITVLNVIVLALV